MLAKVSQARDSHSLQKLGDLIRAEVRLWLPEISVSVGVGRCCDSLRSYAGSYEEARRALDVAKASRHSERTVVYDQLGACGILFDPHVADKLVSTVRRTLDGILEYDRRHGSELVETLDQYFSHDCRLDPTAAALHVQNGTVRYRLRRVQEITGVDLHDVDSKFNLQLSIKVWRALNPQRPR